MKLNSKIHGIIDYGVVLFLWISPSLFNLPHMTSVFTYILGGIHFILTALTIFEMGILKIIPFKIHGIIELIVAIALIGIAFYFGDKEGNVARNYYLGFGAAVFFTWLLTDYKSAEKTM